MKETLNLALLTAGSITHNPVSRYPGIVKLIGPVKAPTFREASRAVNALKGGTAVRSIEEMPSSSLFLLSAPERYVPKLIRDMVEAVPDWRGREVALCSGALDSRDLEPLAKRGAHTASITPLDLFDKPVFLVEGHPRAVQRWRTVLATTRGRVLDIGVHGLPLFTTASDLTSLILLPLLEAATGSLRRAGIPLADAQKMVERMVSRTVRNHVKSGSKTWRVPPHGPSRLRIERQMAALAGTGAKLDAFYQDSLEAAIRFMGRTAQPKRKAAGA